MTMTVTTTTTMMTATTRLLANRTGAATDLAQRIAEQEGARKQ